MKLATERWRSARFWPCCPTRKIALHDARGVGHSGIKRIVVDGDGLRRVARVDGCGRAAEGVAVAGVAMGLVKEGRLLRDPDGHCRSGRPLRRYGFQSRRDARRELPRCRWTSRSWASRRRSCTRRWSRQTRALVHSGQDGRSADQRPREKISAFAPRIYTLKIPVDKIRDLIGPGGKKIAASSRRPA